MLKKKVYPQYFIALALILYVVFFLIPSMLGMYYSLTDWNSYTEKINFVGFENYIAIFKSNQNYAATIKNTILFTIVSNIVKIIPALILAIMLQDNLRGKNIYRAILYLPSVIPFLVIGLTFRSILHPSNGILNQFLRAINLDVLAKQWLINPKTVWPSIFAVDAWRGIGYVMTIFLAGLQSIPASYYEAAVMDGANYFQKLRYITLPMISSAIMINLVFGVTYGLKSFDIIYVLTKGGPGRMTDLVTTAAFSMYSTGKYGMATALNTILFLIATLVGVWIVRMLSKQEVQQ